MVNWCSACLVKSNCDKYQARFEHVDHCRTCNRVCQSITTQVLVEPRTFLAGIQPALLKSLHSKVVAKKRTSVSNFPVSVYESFFGNLGNKLKSTNKDGRITHTRILTTFNQVGVLCQFQKWSKGRG
jgi:hypothetical protein